MSVELIPKRPGQDKHGRRRQSSDRGAGQGASRARLGHGDGPDGTRTALGDAASGANVLNGIAWDPDQGRIYLTGKYWPKTFTVAPPRGIAPAPDRP